MFNYKIFIFFVCFQLTWWMYHLLILLTLSSNEILPCFPFSFFWIQVLPSLTDKHHEFMMRELCSVGANWMAFLLLSFHLMQLH